MVALALTGVKFGRLTAVERRGTRSTFAVWRCVCDCGRWKLVTTQLLTTGKVKSCGCLQTESRRSQRRSGSSKRRTLTFNGDTQSLARWATAYGIKYNTLYARIRRGLSAEASLAAPDLRRTQKTPRRLSASLTAE